MIVICVLQLVAVSIDLQLAAVVVALQRHQMREAADSTALIFPADASVLDAIDINTASTDHVAAVTRGILFSGGMAVSSMTILERCPAFSSQSSECAETVVMSTSPPK